MIKSWFRTVKPQGIQGKCQGIVVGLGNPGRMYVYTRHNMGFMVVDRILAENSAQTAAVDLGQGKAYKTWSWQIDNNDQPWLLVKPMTYMNKSGFAVRDLLNKFDLSLNQVLVLHDELDLPLGKMRFKFQGGLAGHKGLISIASQAGDKSFYRLRIGIGRPAPGTDIVQYVLARFDKDELEEVQEVLFQAVQGVSLFCAQGMQAAANRMH